MTPGDRLPRTSVRIVIARLYVLVALGVAAIGVTTSLGWVHTTFPGFFLMQNRVVPSVGLGHWTGIGDDPIYQRQIVALDGRPVENADQVYATVDASPAARPWTYHLRTESGVEIRTIPSMTFTWFDFLTMFGPLILNGVMFSAVGILVWILGARAPATLGTTLFTIDVGLFCLTALDLYGPGSLFRLHVATEALLPATLLHLALVFPVGVLGSRRTFALRAIYLAGFGLVALYEWHLYTPGTYTRIHNACMAAVGITGLGMVVSCLRGYATSSSLLVRRRLAVLALGILCGFAVPAWVMLTSAIVGGARGLNLAVFTAFLFPLALAYAVVKHDLFEIDALLRRGVSYLALTSTVVALYAVLALASGLVLRRFDLERSPLFPLAFTLLMVFLFNPLRERIQQIVERLYARSRYDPRTTLEHASARLASTLDLDDVCRLALETVTCTFLIETGSVWLRAGDRFVVAESRGFGRLTLAADHALVTRLLRGARGVSIHDFAERDPNDAAARTCERTLTLLGADLVLPIGSADLLGFVVVGPKPSRAIFTLQDIAFLTTFLNQVAVGIRNAQAYRQIAELNESLERKVAARTDQLAAANERLAESVHQLETAYGDLERSQEELIQAERMATLGQLAAGIAHEVNTPLGASLNSLKICRELADEYASSIGDPEVNEEDHRAVASELQGQLRDIQNWASMAATFVRTIKSHTHGADGGHEGPFDVRRTIEEVQILLAHRLRLSSCTMTTDCPATLTIHGDAGKLGQVLTNLVANAIDAYDEAGAGGGAIRVQVAAASRGMRLLVEDDGCGIPADQLTRVFDVLFTTKPRGKGTGLGLSLCREIVERRFGGTIEATSTLGVGTRFTVILPRREADARARETAAAVA